MEQMVLAIRETGSTGELEKKLEEADKQLSYYRKRTENLQKQVSIKTKKIVDLKEQLVTNSGFCLSLGFGFGAGCSQVRPTVAES